ncbi:CPCC family cysteine-rich protein [Streptomyces sp. NPDC017964]|uniref:CPCC family cysteine-rich protein n=1 Tax=Streptomyces sp. NPDC017964 TaxID=3365022 RepID=UPI00379D5AEF
MSSPLPCPCCGHLVLDETPGSYEICPICFWEDDGVQFRCPTMTGGANRVSLIEAQQNYQEFGACDHHGRQHARPPARQTSRSTRRGAPSISPATPSRTGTVRSGPHGPRTVPCCAGGCQPSGAESPRLTRNEPTHSREEPRMASRIAALVQQMDGAADESMDARAELIHIGHTAIPVIGASVPLQGADGGVAGAGQQHRGVCRPRRRVSERCDGAGGVSTRLGPQCPQVRRGGWPAFGCSPRRPPQAGRYESRPGRSLGTRPTSASRPAPFGR